MTGSISVCLLASGNLGLICLKHLLAKNDVFLHSVLTDRKSCGITELCQKSSIPCFAGNPRGGATASFRAGIPSRPDIILSVNYLFLIEDDLISYPIRYAVNVHGSLLPKYRGRTPHVWAIINDEKEAGITAHLITNECDRGGILFQEKVPITKDDTGGSVLRKYNGLYPKIIDNVISAVRSDSVRATEQDEAKATYFPKRTPDDGEINFSWQRERVRNWVRAMAPPEYPGAFFYDNGHKVIVERADLSDLGFPPGCTDGTVILHKGNMYVVKVQNGCISLFEYMQKR